jgi:hypothetical protein
MGIVNPNISFALHSSKIAGLNQDLNYCPRPGLPVLMNPVDPGGAGKIQTYPCSQSQGAHAISRVGQASRLSPSSLISLNDG